MIVHAIHVRLYSMDDDVHGDDLPNMKHKMVYQYYVGWKHGPLGKGNWVEIPDCIKELIRSHYANPDGVYMGHKHKDFWSIILI